MIDSLIFHLKGIIFDLNNVSLVFSNRREKLRKRFYLLTLWFVYVLVLMILPITSWFVRGAYLFVETLIISLLVVSLYLSLVIHNESVLPFL